MPFVLTNTDFLSVHVRMAIFYTIIRVMISEEKFNNSKTLKKKLF